MLPTTPTQLENETRHIFSISELNRSVRGLLEQQFARIWVMGEVSNLAMPSSGHWYFSLKDANAQVRCAFFKPNQRQRALQPTNGQHFICLAKLSLYEPRGDYQLIVEHLELAGEGLLQQAFEQLKLKLHKEGLFATEHKKPLPLIPRCIGLITSTTGAAVRDVLTVLKRRFPLAPVLIYPTLVQGSEAAGQICAAINLANQHNQCDILIVTRGGGSLEDLWPFNEEIVARAIYASNIPIISGVGHEIDTTIADYVADKRAPTPSAAAELATPNTAELLQLLLNQQARLIKQIHQHFAQYQQKIDWLKKRLQQQHPQKQLQQHMQRIDELMMRLQKISQQLILQNRNRFEKVQLRLMHNSPQNYIRHKQEWMATLQRRLDQAIQNRLNHERQTLAILSRALDAVSPLATLQRGYAIVQDPTEQHVVAKVQQAEVGDKIHVRLQDGKLVCDVVDVITY